MNCENCEIYKARQEAEHVPFPVHESIISTLERTIKRLWIIILVLIFLFVGTNAAWIWYECQFEDVVTTYEADARDGGNAVANGNGDVTING